MGIDAARFAAKAAGPKELAVRRGCETAAKHRRKRLALLPVDQTPERQGIGLVPDMPVRRPGQLAETGDAARLGTDELSLPLGSTEKSRSTPMSTKYQS
jgi:hypothetical protein